MNIKLLLLTLFTLSSINHALSQHSIARQWNEVLLEGIRNDYARPTVHARNLYHISTAMYDAWATYQKEANTHFLGNTIYNYEFKFESIVLPKDIIQAQEMAISFACFRIINHRFTNSPDGILTLDLSKSLMNKLGYDTEYLSTDYQNQNPAALGNYIAEQIISYGLQDGSNEEFDYENLYYNSINSPLLVSNPGSQGLSNPNNWQPLAFEIFIDQSGNEIPGNTPDFLGPEWGNVDPFSLSDDDLTEYIKDGNKYKVYHDPGKPSLLDPDNIENSQNYLWNFSLVSVWSSHLTQNDDVMWDISPNSIGNLSIENFPTSHNDFPAFYDQINGGDPSVGYATNPVTMEAYQKQMVPRGDYTRVLAEFWADGPDSETPPGHWFTILNYVSDQPTLDKKMTGTGTTLSDLEWDVKSYFTLAGTMHDAAISAWGIKGYYDFIRPISSIRFLAELGQSSNEELDNYNPIGIPLIPDYIELIDQDDPLIGLGEENLGKIKLYAWKGHTSIQDTELDQADVGWILAENWMPYQRPSFVTPPFAGYVSGHSTYSRAAAEVLTMLTGSEYFPGGIGEFQAKKNEFLVFEEGPSVDITLQWAKYYDASDQCSLSRIWGGIHPPVDDIPGRLIGKKIGISAFNYAKQLFTDNALGIQNEKLSSLIVYPNPSQSSRINIYTTNTGTSLTHIKIISLGGEIVKSLKVLHGTTKIMLDTENISEGIYILEATTSDYKTLITKLIISNN